MNGNMPERGPIPEASQIPSAPLIPNAQPIPEASPMPVAPPIPVAELPRIADPIPVAPPVPIAPYPDIAPYPAIAKKPFAEKFEDVDDPGEREFLTIQEDIRHCGVEMPDPTDIEDYYAEFEQKSVKDVDTAHEMANAVAELRTVSREILEKAQATRETVADAKPEEKKFIENRAYLLALEAGIVDLIAGQTEELMTASSRIIKEKSEKSEDTRSEIKFFASEARRAKISGMIERFKFEVKKALGKY